MTSMSSLSRATSLSSSVHGPITIASLIDLLPCEISDRIRCPQVRRRPEFLEDRQAPSIPCRCGQPLPERSARLAPPGAAGAVAMDSIGPPRKQDDATFTAAVTGGPLFGLCRRFAGELTIRNPNNGDYAARSKNHNHSWIDCFQNIRLPKNRLLPD